MDSSQMRDGSGMWSRFWKPMALKGPRERMVGGAELVADWIKALYRVFRRVGILLRLLGMIAGFLSLGLNHRL
jgi:hypothetical protein